MASKFRRSIATIDLIENSRKSKECIDEIYEKLRDIIYNEMEASIQKVVYTCKNKNNRLNNSKPNLTDQLTELWETKRESKNKYLRYTGEQKVKFALRREYIESRDIFNKSLRRTERAY